MKRQQRNIILIRVCSNMITLESLDKKNQWCNTINISIDINFYFSGNPRNKYLDGPCAELFVQQNLQKIMVLMKYSLKATNPWITKYFDKYKVQDPLSFPNIKSFFNFWISSYDYELKNLIDDNGKVSNQMKFAFGWR